MIEVIDGKIAERESFITRIDTLSIPGAVCRHSVINSLNLFPFRGTVGSKFFRGWIFSWNEGGLVSFVTEFYR